MSTSPLKIILSLLLFFSVFFSCSAFSSQRTINIGMSGTYPPFNTKSPNGVLYGFDKDIGNMICKHNDLNCNYIIIPFKDINNALKDGKIDVIISSLSDNDVSNYQFNSSVPYYITTASLLSKKSITISNINDATQYDVAVSKDSTSHKILSHYIPSDKLHIETDASLLISDIVQDKYPVISENSIMLKGWLNRFGTKCCHLNLEVPNSLSPIRIYVQKDDPKKLITLINNTINASDSNGNFEALSKRYFGYKINR